MNNDCANIQNRERDENMKTYKAQFARQKKAKKILMQV